ncbi:MAG: hypothetical protein Q9M16_10475 [Mariprofundus sp.]|nr:hypothetical protein [Mariprofundus sp.]
MNTDIVYFTESEFGAWWPFMSDALLTRLDAFRKAWGNTVIISPAAGSLGRYMDKGAGSQHNVTRWGEVRAADIMPLIDTPNGARSLSRSELRQAYDVALSVGFTGIGAYPDWRPHPGLHVDVRTDRTQGSPATWSGIRTANGQEYFGVERAFT